MFRSLNFGLLNKFIDFLSGLNFCHISDRQTHETCTDFEKQSHWKKSMHGFTEHVQYVYKSTYMLKAIKVGANTWSIMHEFLKLLWIVNIHQKAKACSCRLYRVTTQKVAQILSRNRGKN